MQELELDSDTSPWTTQWKNSLLAASRLTDSPAAPRSQWCQQEWRGKPNCPLNRWVLMNCTALQKAFVFTTKMHYFILPPTSVFIFSLGLLLFWFHLASTFLGFFPLCPSSHLSLPFFFFLSFPFFFFFFFFTFSALSGFTTHLGSLQWHCFYSSEAEGP